MKNLKPIKTPCTECNALHEEIPLFSLGAKIKRCSLTMNGHGKMRAISEVRKADEECPCFEQYRIVTDNYCRVKNLDNGYTMVTAFVNGKPVITATSYVNLDEDCTAALQDFINEYTDCHIEYLEEKTKPHIDFEGQED